MANTLNKDNVKIWIAPAGTVGADLSDDATIISGYVTGFSDSGFGADFEQIDVAGGNVSGEQSRAMIEGSLDIVLTDGVDRDTFHQIKMGEFDFGMIAIQKNIDGTKYLWEAINNVKSPNFEGDFAMDGNWEGTLSFNSTAFDERGYHNWDYGTTDIEHVTTGLVAGNSRTLADGVTTRLNSWEITT